jgi:hypothetical protein
VVIRAVFVMYLVGRYTAVTGQSFAQRVATLPGPRGWLLLLFVIGELAVLATGLTAIAKPCGNLGVFLLQQYSGLSDALGLANPETARWWENGVTSIFLGAALAVSLGSSYVSLEKQQIVICGLMVAGTAAATLVVGPNLIEMLRGAVRIGHLPPAPDWAPPPAKNDYGLNLATIFGYVGGGLSGYIAYSNWVGLHGWGLSGDGAARELAARSRPSDFRLPARRSAAGGKSPQADDAAALGRRAGSDRADGRHDGLPVGRRNGALSTAHVARRGRGVRTADKAGRDLGADQPVAGAGLLRLGSAGAVGDNRQRAGSGRARGVRPAVGDPTRKRAGSLPPRAGSGGRVVLRFVAVLDVGRLSL